MWGCVGVGVGGAGGGGCGVGCGADYYRVGEQAHDGAELFGEGKGWFDGRRVRVDGGGLRAGEVEGSRAAVVVVVLGGRVDGSGEVEGR